MIKTGVIKQDASFLELSKVEGDQWLLGGRVPGGGWQQRGMRDLGVKEVFCILNTAALTSVCISANSFNCTLNI